MYNALDSSCTIDSYRSRSTYNALNSSFTINRLCMGGGGGRYARLGVSGCESCNAGQCLPRESNAPQIRNIPSIITLRPPKWFQVYSLIKGYWALWGGGGHCMFHPFLDLRGSVVPVKC